MTEITNAPTQTTQLFWILKQRADQWIKKRTSHIRVVDSKEVKEDPIHTWTQYPHNFAQTMPIQPKQAHIYDTATFQSVVTLCVKILYQIHHYSMLTKKKLNIFYTLQ